MPIIFLYMEL